jgi:hypothetical protein
MRADRQKMQAQQKEGMRNGQKDFENRRQLQSLANRDRDGRGNDETGQGKVRSQEPNRERGHHQVEGVAAHCRHAFRPGRQSKGAGRAGTGIIPSTPGLRPGSPCLRMGDIPYQPM